MIIKPLRVWVQNILPVVYDDSLSYLEIVAKINAKTNEIISQTNENTHAIETLANTIAELGDIEELRALLDEIQTIVDDLYSTDAPLMDETASAGSANHAARSDHVHPSDTSKLNKANIANSEDGDSATNSYSTGDYLLRNGTFYKVLSNISVGDSFLIGTNIEETEIGSEIANLNSINSEINTCLTGKTIALLGDSNALGWANSNPFANVPIAHFYNYAVGGATWNTQSAESHMEDQYGAMVAAGINPDIVILWCGGNDVTGATFPDLGLPQLGDFSRPTGNTWFESMRRVLYDLRNNYPSAKLLGFARDDRSDARYNRFNYGFGIMERIYAAWNIPVISFDSISNITPEITASKNANFSDGIHYNSVALARITAMIVNAIRTGMTNHAARVITNIFCPSTIHNAKDATNWCLSTLFNDGTYSNRHLPQNGFRVWYKDNTDNFVTCSVNISEPAVGIGFDENGKAWIKDTKSFFGQNNHELSYIHETTGAVSSLKDIPSGITITSTGHLASTVGLPTEFQTYFETGGGMIFGAWKANGWFFGMITLPFTSTLNNVFTISYNASTDTWEYWSADHQIFYNASGT